MLRGQEESSTIRLLGSFTKRDVFGLAKHFFYVQYIHDIIHNLYVETDGIPQHGWINLQGSSRAKMLGLHLTPDPPSVCTMCTPCWISTMLGA